MTRMGSVLEEKISNFYHESMNDADKITSNWFLMSTPWPVVSLLFLYIFIVLEGQKRMKTRDAVNVKTILIIYNGFLVLLSVYMLYEFVLSVIGIPNFNFFCQGVHNIEEHPSLMRHAIANWLFLMSKIMEFLDTIFLIINKKSVSFLHAYHHVSVCVLWWIIVKWHPGGTTYFGAILNCFVHGVMYSYYLLSALGPQYKKYLWWKKYLTSLQLLQFTMVFVYVLNAMTVADCSYPRWLLWLFIGYDISLMILFGNFYFQQYVKNGRKESKLKTK